MTWLSLRCASGAQHPEDYQRGLSGKVVNEVFRQGGQMPLLAVLRCRIKYFTDGAVLGSREFVVRWINHQQADR